MNEVEILKKYKLSEAEHDFYYDIIKRTYTSGKIPTQNPIAVIIGGQTGAGKSSLIGYSTEMFSDDNVVIINSDEIKPFHPKSEEIARLYPKMYTKITDQESNTWTSRLFEELRREGYNIIFEGTMKNNRIADESIPELQQLGYTVIVRGLAVCDSESRMSILERYEGQVSKKGWGRLVVTDHHNQTYDGMPNTIDYIEQNGRYDILEIFARGEELDEPVNLYAKHNPNSKEKIERVVAGRKYVSKHSRKFGFNSARESVYKSREEEYDWVIPTLEERIKIVMQSMEVRNATEEEKQMALDLMSYWQEGIKKKQNNKNIAGKLISSENGCQEGDSISQIFSNLEQSTTNVYTSYVDKKTENAAGAIPSVQEGIKVVFQSMIDISETDEEKKMILGLMSSYQEFIGKRSIPPKTIGEDAR